jgi:hypothetical protein
MRSLSLAALWLILGIGSGVSNAAENWYQDILTYRKEVFRLEVRWSTNDGTQCDLPDVGTGFLFSNHGRIVTATHVIEKTRRKPECSPEIFAYPDAGSSTNYKARVIKSLSNDTVSVIQLVGFDNDSTLKASESKALKEGDEIFYMGYPGGSWSWNTGRITNTNVNTNLGAGLYLVEMSSSRGASGSPVFDKCGGVVGVVIGRPDPDNPGQTGFFPLELSPNIAALAVQAQPCGGERPLIACRVQVEAASDSIVTRSTGWRGGGYDPTSWCNNLLATVTAEQPTAAVTLVPNSAIEDSRDSCSPFNCRQYNYTCSVKVHKDPKFVEQTLPTCPK